MWTSADRRSRRRPLGGRSEGGFTLLEVLVTLAIVALAIVPMMVVRDAAWNIAYRSGHMLRAAAYAEGILAERMTDPDDVKEYQAAIEEDPAFHYELTIETYDLSTGRVEQLDDDAFSTTSKFSAGSVFEPSDAGDAPEDEDEAENPHRERRFTLRVMYPGLHDDAEEQYVLEGYLPIAKKESDHVQAAAK